MAYKPRKDIKVPESYIQKLRDTGSKKAALEKYGKSTDPKMREALRRFYGASSIAPLGASSRSRAQSRPRSSVPMPKNVSQAKPKASVGSRNSGPVVQNRRSAAPTTKAPNREAANRAAANKDAGNKVALGVASLVPAVRLARAGAAGISNASRIRAAVPGTKAAIKAAKAKATREGKKAAQSAAKKTAAKKATTKKVAPKPAAKKAAPRPAAKKTSSAGPKSATAKPKPASTDTSKLANEVFKNTTKYPRKTKNKVALSAYAAYLSSQQQNKRNRSK
jgi:hypothetical protein